jgi:RHS repeat-associated protein
MTKTSSNTPGLLQMTQRTVHTKSFLAMQRGIAFRAFGEAIMGAYKTISLAAVTSAVLCMGWAAVASAEVKDPAPVSDEALEYVYKALNIGGDDPLITGVQRRMDEATGLVDRFSQHRQAGDAGKTEETRALLRSKTAEFKSLKSEALARLGNKAHLGPALPLQLGSSNRSALAKTTVSPSQAVSERFDAVAQALEKLADAKPGQEQAALATARQILHTLRSRNQPELEMDPGQVPTWTLAEPTQIKPEDLPEGPEPQYVASNRRAPGNNVYAFLGNTLLAALPDQVPPEATTCSFTAPDLAENMEVKLTAEIKALAEKLEYSPVRIYAYVNKEIAFEPYYGSLKGAMGTLVSKAGNATDHASLLIALLRASNIPARYVRGQVQFTDDTRGLEWIGAKTYVGARSILTRGGVSAGSSATSLWFDHVWVEACVPYGNYRGTKVDKTGHRWIPLDASFKEKVYQAGIAVNVDFDYDAYLAYRTNGADSLPHEAFAKQVGAAVKALPPHYENNTVEDVPYTGKQITRRFDILPASLPYQIKSFTAWGGGITETETPEVPETHRYRLEISGVNLPSTLTLYMPQISLSRLTLGFSPVSGSDKTELDRYLNTGTAALLAYSPQAGFSIAPVNMQAVIRVDGTPVITGNSFDLMKDVIVLGILPDFNLAVEPKTLTLNMALKVGNSTYNSVSFNKKIKGTDIYALFADAFQTSDRLLRERAERLLNNTRTISDPNTNPDETIGEYLHLVGLKYLRYIDDAGKRIGALDGGSGWGGNHIGATSTVAKSQYLFDLPYALSNAGALKGMLVDFPGGQSRNVDLSTGQAVWKTFLLGGFAMSALESYVWQENGRADAVSTVRGIQFAREQGIEVLTINSANQATEIPKLTSNADSSLNYHTATVSQIQSQISQGYKFTIPRSLILYDNWKGGVWVSEKQSGGNWSAGYIISGGYAGGYLTKPISNRYVLPPLSLASLPNFLSLSTGVNQSNLNYASAYVDVLPPMLHSWTNFGASGGNIYSGDPVNMVTGNMYHTERDIALKGRGGFPIVFERSYNSRDTQDGPLGFGWTHSFNQYLTFGDDNHDGASNGADTDGITSAVTWVDGTAARKFIQVTGIASGVPLSSPFTAPKGSYFTTTRNGNGTYTIREKNGLTYTFENVPGTLGQKARLTHLEDRNGNKLTLAYSAGCGNRLCSVTDGLGRSLTFTYDGNSRILEIKDWTNRAFQYGYDSNGNLTSFKNPLAVAGSQNPVSYDYYTSDPKLIHAMKRYTLPRGNGMIFEYYTNGKVFKHYTTAGETMTFTYNDFRRESVTVNERGHTRRFFYDANANLVQLVEENGAVRTYAYDANDFTRRLSKRDPEGYTTNYAYDAGGNVTQIANPSGNTVAMSHFNSFNQPGKLKDARGNYTLLQYDAKGNLTNEFVLKPGSGAGHVPASYTPVPSELVAWTTHSYDSYGNRASSKQVRDFSAQVGPVYSYAYDAGSLNIVNFKRQGDKDGDGVLEGVETSPTLVYDSLGRPTTDLSGNWYPITKVYDSVDRITRMTDGLGNLRDYKYDANGNPIEQSLTLAAAGMPALIDHTAAQYDISDRMTANTDSAGNVTAYQYDALGNVVKITNPDNYSVAIEYDEANHVVKAYDQEGHAVTKTVDLSGKPRTVTDPNGNTVKYEYYGSERDGRLKQITDAADRVTTFDYDANGNAISVTDNLGRVTMTFYDALNRPTRIVGPVYTDATLAQIRPVTRYTYNALGHLTSVSAGSTDFTGTNEGADVLTPQASYAYDDFGRKIRETDALGKSWTFEYDPNNNLTRVTDAKDQVTQFTYGFGGQLLTRTDATGKKTAYTYNALGQVLTAQSPEVTYSHTYDAAHRLASVTDSRGGKKLSYDWSPGGLLNLMADNEGRRTDYLYDSVGRLTGIWAPNNDYVAFVYDAGGRLAEKWFPNGINAQYTWNPDNTLAQVKNRFNYSDTFVVSQHDYTYNGVGQRKDASEKLGVYTPPAMNDAYTYDPVGNRQSKTDGVNPLYYVYDAANQLLEVHAGSEAGPMAQAFVYDANGNLTRKCEGGTVTRSETTCGGASVTSLAYDALNRLAQVDKNGQLSQYAYDDADRRIRKTVNGSTVNYLYNGPDILAEYQNWNQANVTWTHGPNTDDPLVREAANDARYYHQDGLGSVVATTDVSGNLTAAQLYDAWGKPHPTATQGNIAQYGYTGREPDETGMMYYRARYYDPTIGRFTQRDPLGMPDGVNRYAYVAGDPLNNVDPEGLIKADPQSVMFTELNKSYVGNGRQEGTSQALSSGKDNFWSGLKEDFGSYVQRSIDGVRSDSLGDGVNRVLQGFGPELGVAVAAIGSIKSVKVGQAGEEAVREVYDIGNKTGFNAGGKNRIADGLNRALKTVSEVKNTATQAFTRQLRDYTAYAQQEGMRFDLYVRESTKLSGPLKDAIHSGLINLRLIPK